MRCRVTSFRLIAVVIGVGLSIIASGCGGYSAEAHRVDPANAKQVLQDVLTSWKEGATPDSWQQKDPQVVVQDMEWKAGAKLTSFEIVGEGTPVDANLHCEVKLQLEIPEKGAVEKTVTYLVGTSPVVTVFRAMGP